MTTLRVASDLHLNHYGDIEGRMLLSRIFGDGEYDLAVVAGDLADGDSLLEWVEALRRAVPAHIPIVRAMGNHCHAFVARQPLRGIVEPLGLRVGVCTLWYDKKPDQWFDERYIPQFRQNYSEWWEKDRFFMTACMVNKVDLMVTHMVPREDLIHPKYATLATTRYFFSDTRGITDVFGGPKLWIYGHTHEENDVTINGTRYVCRPIGYPNEPNHRRPDIAAWCTIECD